jgi:hypothetical protein
MSCTNPGEVRTAVMVGYEEKMKSMTVSADAVSATITLDLNEFNVFRLTLDGSVQTLAISNNPGSGNAGTFTLVLQGDGTARVFSWPNSIKWISGAPAVPSTNGNCSVYTFTSFDQGTDWLGLVIATDINGL